MIDSVGATDQPVKLGARRPRAVLAQAGIIAAGACLLALEFALAFGWSDWMLAVWLIFFLTIWLPVLAGSTEWTIAGHELRRRRWLSRPGSEPSVVMALGPQVEMVHKSRLVWSLVPTGPVLAWQPWQARRFVEAVQEAGVPVNDWRGEWARRHRRLDMLGLVVFYGGLAGIIVMPAIRAQWPGAFTATAGLACAGAAFLGLAIDYLPWEMRKIPAHDGWPPLSAGAAAGAWVQQTQLGPAPGLEFGGFWLRVLAYLIDISLLGIVGIILSSALGAAGQAIGALMFIAYFTGLWGLTGQTIGMMPLGLHVVRDVDGGKISWSHAVLRFVGLFVAFACVYIGVIWIAFDSRKRGWHDRIGGTVVVRNVGVGSAGESTRRLNVRQGAMAGVIVSFVVAASAAGSSNANLQTFVLVLAVPLTVTVVITAVAMAINRRTGGPRDL